MTLVNGIKKAPFLSRVASRAFSAVGFIARDTLLRDLRLIQQEFPAPLQESFYRLLRSRGFIQSFAADLPFTAIQSFQLAKTISAEKLEALAEEFGSQEGWCLRVSGRQLVLIRATAATPLAVTDGIDQLTIRAMLLYPEKPFTLEEILQEAKRIYPAAEEKDLKFLLRQLWQEGKVGFTIDQEYFWLEASPSLMGKDHLLQNRALFPIHGTRDFVSAAGLKKRISSGKMVEVLTFQNTLYLWKKDFASWEREGQTIKVAEKKGRFSSFLTAEIPEALRKGMLVCGLKEDGSPLYVLAHPETFVEYRREILLYEAERLSEELEINHRLQPAEKEGFRQKLRAIFAVWEQEKIIASPYQNLYAAKRVAQMRGSATAVLAALLSLPPYEKAKEKLAGHSLFAPTEAEEILDMIYDAKTAASFPFRLSRADNHFIQNFMWMLMVTLRNPDALRLLLASKLRTLVFSPRSVNYEEIKFLYAPLAERFGLAEVAEDLRNLTFQAENPVSYNEYEGSIRSKTGLDLQAAKRYLADFSRRLKAQLVAVGIPAAALQVRSRRKTEAAAFEKVAGRKQRDFADLPDLLAVKIIFDDQTRAAAAEREARNLDHLRLAQLYLEENYPAAGGSIEDSIERPRASGWQAVTMERVVTGEGKEVELQLMTQRMHENEQFLLARQAHWCYAVQRELPRQKFDESPLEILERLTGNLDHDYPLIRNYLLSRWTFVFFVREGEKLRKNQKESLALSVLKGEAALFIKRTLKGATPVDLAAAEGRLAQYAGAEIYTFGFDRNDQPATQPFSRSDPSPPNLAVNHPLRHGEAVILKGGPRPFSGNAQLIKTAVETAKRPATVITLRSLLSDRRLAGDAARGREALASLAFAPGQMERVQSQYKFSSLDDLYAAVGSGLIRTEEIAEFSARVLAAAESQNGDQILIIKAPDRKGLIDSVLSHLPAGSPLTQLASRSYYLFGEKRFEMRLRLASTVGLRVGVIREDVKRRLTVYSGREYPAEVYTYSFRVRSLAGRWQIKELIQKLSQENINIAAINLPEIKAGEEKDGILEIEIPHVTLREADYFDALLEDLKSCPGVVEIS